MFPRIQASRWMQKGTIAPSQPPECRDLILEWLHEAGFIFHSNKTPPHVTILTHKREDRDRGALDRRAEIIQDTDGCCSEGIPKGGLFENKSLPDTVCTE